MKLIKVPGIIIIAVILTSNICYSGMDAQSVGGLNQQLVKEVKTKLETPSLLFSSKELKGAAMVTAKVNDSGKIEFISIRSTNKNLIKNIKHKLNKLNLWTDPQLHGKVFVYKVNYKES
ncbi:MAG: hypothetical protein OZ913_00985 [Ignavibacteriaceae bacterium]|nr:MAG: hypothetical protein UZ04_CHB001001447 [Chlorobi bacterium OLB4]MBW7855494.1 hypothetical protein [Ignavibacteria bacterium]MEB2328863.1 hypothetical protein [Ignavibacteriaceae bacterium]